MAQLFLLHELAGRNTGDEGHVTVGFVFCTSYLLVPAQERSVSPPDLPLPNVHYQKFGLLLRLVHSGRRFLPLTPENVESKSLPTYAVEVRRWSYCL